MLTFFVGTLISVAAITIGQYSGPGVTTKPNLAYGSFKNAGFNTNGGGGKELTFWLILIICVALMLLKVVHQPMRLSSCNKGNTM